MGKRQKISLDDSSLEVRTITDGCNSHFVGLVKPTLDLDEPRIVVAKFSPIEAMEFAKTLGEDKGAFARAVRKCATRLNASELAAEADDKGVSRLKVGQRFQKLQAS